MTQSQTPINTENRSQSTITQELDSFDKIILKDWVADNWSKFQYFCEERGVDANEIYIKLGGEPD